MGEAKRKQQAEAKHLADCGDFVEALDALIKFRAEQKHVSETGIDITDRIYCDGIDAQCDRGREGFKRGTVQQRIHLGWDHTEALTTPVQGRASIS